MSYKTGGVSWGLWFDKHEQYIGIITDREHLKKCNDCKDSWESVADSLRVTCASRCGARIFGDKLQLVAHVAVSAAIDAEVATFANGKMNSVAVKACMVRSMQACKNLGREFAAAKGKLLRNLARAKDMITCQAGRKTAAASATAATCAGCHAKFPKLLARPERRGREEGCAGGRGSQGSKGSAGGK